MSTVQGIGRLAFPFDIDGRLPLIHALFPCSACWILQPINIYGECSSWKSTHLGVVVKDALKVATGTENITLEASASQLVAEVGDVLDDGAQFLLELLGVGIGDPDEVRVTDVGGGLDGFGELGGDTLDELERLADAVALVRGQGLAADHHEVVVDLVGERVQDVDGLVEVVRQAVFELAALGGVGLGDLVRVFLCCSGE